MIALLLLLAGTGKGGKSIWDKNFNDEFRQSLKVIPSSCLVSSCLVSSYLAASSDCRHDRKLVYIISH